MTHPMDPEHEHITTETQPKPAVIRHGCIEAVMGTNPPRLLMRSGELDAHRYEIEWVGPNEPVTYLSGPNHEDELETTAGWLVQHLLNLIQSREMADGQAAVDEHRPPVPAPAYAGHLTHTTVPTPTTVTTAFGQITVADFASVVLSRVDVDPEAPIEPAPSGRFIVTAHGLDYEGHQPKALWVQLRPLVDPDDPNGWIEPERVLWDSNPGSHWGTAGLLTTEQAQAAAERYLERLKPKGFLADPPPNDTAKEKTEARAALDLVRELMVEGVLSRTASGEWHVQGDIALDPESLALDETAIDLLDGLDSARWDSLDQRDRA